MPSWRLVVRDEDAIVFYLQVEDTAARCAVTGEPTSWRGRKWMLSRHMTETEIVCTAFKVLETALDHELREHFTYRGCARVRPAQVRRVAGGDRRPRRRAGRAGMTAWVAFGLGIYTGGFALILAAAWIGRERGRSASLCR